MTLPDQNELREKLEKLWIERNGTGTDACSTCRPPHICAWHTAMIDEQIEIVQAEILAAQLSLLDSLDHEPQMFGDWQQVIEDYRTKLGESK